MKSILEEAVDFAVLAHKNQYRKYTGAAYITHPFSVMGMMTEFTQDPEVLSACVLHDTVEDCEDVNIEVIHSRFGETVGSYVFYTSEISQKSDGNRKFRKHKDNIHYSMGPFPAQNIKGLDMLDNIPSIILFDREFGATYLKEKQSLLAHLTKIDSTIKQRCVDLINNMFFLLEKY